VIEDYTQMSALLIAVVGAALLFDFVNGWNDSANAIATVVSTRVLSPTQAVILAAVFNLVGAMAGTAVAKTITAGIIRPEHALTTSSDVVYLVLSAMIAAAIWAAAMTLKGLPISGSHSLIGGIVGAGLAAFGASGLIWTGLGAILVAMLLSPLLGALLAFLFSWAGRWICSGFNAVSVQRVFRKLQILSASVMAFNHGLNDAQKVMGVITMALVAGGVQSAPLGTSPAPLLWVKFACAFAISLGTALGGWKVIHTLGSKLSKLTPFDGFQAEASASGVLLLAASLGIPVSTTHTITGSIVGVGITKGVRSVKWIVGEKIIYAWIFTLPATAAGGFLCYRIIEILR
jgi:PiT family inorganic phosphate transporter